LSPGLTVPLPFFSFEAVCLPALGCGFDLLCFSLLQHTGKTSILWILIVSGVDSQVSSDDSLLLSRRLLASWESMACLGVLSSSAPLRCLVFVGIETSVNFLRPSSEVANRSSSQYPFCAGQRHARTYLPVDIRHLPQQIKDPVLRRPPDIGPFPPTLLRVIIPT
jgi:hypothetical protein